MCKRPNLQVSNRWKEADAFGRGVMRALLSHKVSGHSLDKSEGLCWQIVARPPAFARCERTRLALRHALRRSQPALGPGPDFATATATTSGLYCRATATEKQTEGGTTADKESLLITCHFGTLKPTLSLPVMHPQSRPLFYQSFQAPVLAWTGGSSRHRPCAAALLHIDTDRLSAAPYNIGE